MYSSLLFHIPTQKPVLRSTRLQLRAVALERINILLELAIAEVSVSVEEANRQAGIARRLAMKYNVRLPYHKRRFFCRGCHAFIPPGLGARIRVNSSGNIVKTTCLLCGHVSRKILVRRLKAK